MSRKKVSESDIHYIRWLQDRGWLTSGRWKRSGKTQREAIACEIGVSPDTIRNIANRQSRLEIPEEGETQCTLVEH